jgi:hypothetical protein
MRRLFSWELLSLLLVAMAAGAIDNPNQAPQSPNNPPADSATPLDTGVVTTPPATSTPSVTVTGNAPPLPKCRISSDWTHLISFEWDHPISG